MNKYNYSLTYKDNLRWRDFRSENQHFTASTPVKLDIVTYTDNSQTMLHIHNYNTRSAYDTDKNVKQTLSCIVGVGRIRCEIFGVMQYRGLEQVVRNENEGCDRLFIGYLSGARICYLANQFLFTMKNYLTYNNTVLWHVIPNVDTKDLPLVLAIPLTIVSVK